MQQYFWVKLAINKCCKIICKKMNNNNDSVLHWNLRTSKYYPTIYIKRKYVKNDR